jgi:hypothetical protein
MSGDKKRHEANGRQRSVVCSVTQYGTDAAEENITIKLETEPKEQSLSLTVPYHRIWTFTDAIRSAASLAAQCQQQVPFSQIVAVAPYLAASVQVGHHPTTGQIALHLQTSEGIPLQIAMDRELAETTISLLQLALDESPDGSKNLS